ncbi:MAG: helix-turn-helix domain-containing protein [Clostridiales Family XIII bacterium]|jgi:AraC-like DNA-binding protein|nr:helix-turn-helix domain-containing protein [Clostridiales Family XIII bacterium]
MKTQKAVISPKQPFFVLATGEYFKVPVMQYGISHFYCYRTDSDPEKSNILAVPDGCVDLICYCDEGAGKQGKAIFYGTVFEPEEIAFRPDSYIFGVRFLPCYNPVSTVPELFPLLAHEKTADARDVMRDMTTLDAVMATTDFRTQIRTFMDAYMKNHKPQGADTGPLPLSGYVAGEIVRTAGSAKFEEIADEAGYSTRYLNRMFTDAFGFSPKTFSRIMRFQNMIGALCVGKEPDFSEFAAELGYADQSHMIKDFKEFVHLTPKKYLNALNTGHYNEKLIIL